MKHSTVLSLFLALGLVLSGTLAVAQEDEAAGAAADSASLDDTLEYSDYSVKAYSISAYAGSFYGDTFLDLPFTETRTTYGTPPPPNVLGPGDILGYDGLPLLLAREVLPDQPSVLRYNSAQKEIKSGTAFGGRVGIFVSEAFHLDIVGAYSKSKAVTTMLRMPDDGDPEKAVRVQVDEDDGFSTYRGGLALMYDAHPAAFFGIVPRLGFGIGGIINSFTDIEEKTALYLEGSLGLTKRIFSTVDLYAQYDINTFSFEVEELGYSNAVAFGTLSLGISWWIDRLPPSVRASHNAGRDQR